MFIHVQCMLYSMICVEDFKYKIRSGFLKQTKCFSKVCMFFIELHLPPPPSILCEPGCIKACTFIHMRYLMPSISASLLFLCSCFHCACYYNERQAFSFMRVFMYVKRRKWGVSSSTKNSEKSKRNLLK